MARTAAVAVARSVEWINGRAIAKVKLAGKLDRWSDEYFKKPLFGEPGDATKQNYDKLPELAAPGVPASMVLFYLVGSDIDSDDDVPLPETSHAECEGAFTITID